jgi:hypothetical protein
MIDDDCEPSISDSQPGAQVIELTDSLDLSRLNISQNDRAILAQILVDLETEESIPCADLAILGPEKTEVALTWRYRVKERVILFSIVLNLTDYSTKCTATTSKEQATISHESLVSTVHALSVLHNHNEVQKVSSQPYSLN